MKFCNDFDLIVKNCEAYNGAESEYMEQAKQLETEFHKLVSVHFPDHASLSPPNLTTINLPESNTTTSAGDQAHNTSADDSGYKRCHGSLNLTCDEEDVYGDGDLGKELVQTDVVIGSGEDGDSDDSELELPSFRSLFTPRSTDKK